MASFFEPRVLPRLRSKKQRLKEEAKLEKLEKQDVIPPPTEVKKLATQDEEKKSPKPSEVKRVPTPAIVEIEIPNDTTFQSSSTAPTSGNSVANILCDCC